MDAPLAQFACQYRAGGSGWQGEHVPPQIVAKKGEKLQCESYYHFTSGNKIQIKKTLREALDVSLIVCTEHF